MSDNEKKDIPMENHEYDGIQELNNPAPFWWQLFFAISIAFAIVYFAYYELGSGPTSDQQLAENMKQIEIAQAQGRPTGPNTQELLAAFADAERVKNGKETFTSKCVSCHLADGGGSIGPNLTDSSWIHGKGKLVDIYNVVRNGVADKGMPPWGGVLSEKELVNVVAFCKTFQGTKPATAKAQQGTVVTAEESKD